MDLTSIGNFLNSNSGTIGSLLGTGAQLYGQQNAGQAISSAATSGMNTATTAMGNINSLYGAQTSLGNSSMNSLNTMLNGTGSGGTPDYSAFMNMPGYQFAQQMGVQSAERQAAAMGNAGNSGTAAMIGNQVTGTAMQDYNTYIGQLQQAAGLGASANQTLTGANLQTAGNIEQLGMNSGMAQAGMYTGMGQTISGGLGGNAYGAGTANGTGVAGAASGLGGLLGSGIKMLGGALGGGSTTGGAGGYSSLDTTGLTYSPTTGSYTLQGNPYDTNASGIGQYTLDPTTGQYTATQGSYAGLTGDIDSNSGTFIADPSASLDNGLSFLGD
jgi:hypothetical protein